MGIGPRSNPVGVVAKLPGFVPQFFEDGFAGIEPRAGLGGAELGASSRWRFAGGPAFALSWGPLLILCPLATMRLKAAKMSVPCNLINISLSIATLALGFVVRRL